MIFLEGEIPTLKETFFKQKLDFEKFVGYSCTSFFIRLLNILGVS